MARLLQDQPIYRDGRHYDAINAHTHFDLAFYSKRAKHAAGSVLELACGTGRITLPLARLGFDITGLDLSDSMLARAKAKATQEGLAIPWIQGDCRTFSLDRRFDLIFMAYDSFLYLYDRASQQAFFDRVQRHLTPSGCLIFDAFNPLPLNLPSEWSALQPLASYPDPDSQEPVVVQQRSRYNDSSHLLEIEWHFKKGSSFQKTELIRLRCHTPTELDQLVRSCGFSILEKFGDYEGQPFSENALHQVVVCRPSEALKHLPGKASVS